MNTFKIVNFEHLQNVVLTQRKVRGLEEEAIEGSVYNLQLSLEHANSLGLIDMYQLDKLVRQLNAP